MTETKSRLAGYRQRRDNFFATHQHSPLTEAQRAKFTGLDYFPEREDLVLALDLDESGDNVGEEVVLETTDQQHKPFFRAGKVSFEVEGQPVKLTILRDGVRGSFFLPFRDASAGDETYEVGRYLEPQLLPDGRLHVDLNYAYNPFCAYGSGWSCPIPPAENHLSVMIPAGERAFRLPD
ncbi:MAG: DUF1684 domain-containing protein [Thermomicrobiales bacterium]|nr:DUF1684 domain-containing protein [Thermomicrobiales bacterium]